jgi:hypothetical protein
MNKYLNFDKCIHQAEPGSVILLHFNCQHTTMHLAGSVAPISSADQPQDLVCIFCPSMVGRSARVCSISSLDFAEAYMYEAIYH